MNVLTKIFRPSAVKAAEGEVRPGPWLVAGGWIPSSWPWNYWQQGRNPIPYGEHSTIVEACVAAYSQTIAMCPGSHWLTLPNGGRERIINSDLNRILRRPNGYQSISDYFLNSTRNLFLDGNSYSLAIRNNRGEVDQLHLMDPASCDVSAISPEGDLFYSLQGNPVIDKLGLDLRFVPARDVLHIRLHTTKRRPFKGESPLMAAAMAAATHGAMTQQQLAFISNQSRPSGTLNTDLKLTREQVEELRESWDTQARSLGSGGAPILTAGLKWTPMSQPATDSQLAEMMKMTREDIALAFRVPLQILGLGGTTFASTEALMQSWVSQSLGFVLNHIEEAFGNFFKLIGQPEEYLELDTSALLRSAYKERIEGLVRAVQGGLYSPNDARRIEGYPDVEGGDEPRVQQQLVPLSFGAEQPEPPPAPAPVAPPAGDDEGDEDERDYTPEVIAGRIHELARIH